jgi:hypothetical protein
VLQVEQLLASSSFQRYSGPVLERLTLQPWRDGCFNFSGPPEAFLVKCFQRRSDCLAVLGCWLFTRLCKR